MNKKIVGILVFVLLTASVFLNTISSEANHVTDDDLRITTGPVPPPNCGKDLDPTLLTGKIIISDVPIYRWHHGCGPTSAGMLIGYWDGKGFGDLVDGSAQTQTATVNNVIASTENYNDYCLPIDKPPVLRPDKSEPPVGDEHDDNCLADFMKTSQSYYENYYGWGWFKDVEKGLEDYVEFKTAHSCSGQTLYYSQSLWSKYCAEIDAKRPVLLLVDSDGDGSSDHFICAIGYDDDHNYACYNTWDTSLHWYHFSSMGAKFGIFGAVFFTIENYPPIARFTYTPSSTNPDIDETITFDASSSYDKDGEIVSYDWTIDGSYHKTGVKMTYSFSTYGAHRVELKVKDDFGDEDIFSREIICGNPDLYCEGSLVWSDVGAGRQTTGSFTVENIGDPNTLLDWEIWTVPEWGEWYFTPEEGTGLTPESGKVTVKVTVVAPDEKNTAFSGNITIKNKKNSSDISKIPVSLETKDVVQYKINYHTYFLERFAIKFPVLTRLLQLVLFGKLDL